MKMTIKDHPYYFGAYANMARHNVFMVLNDIAKKVRQGVSADSEEIDEHDNEAFLKGKKDKVYVAPPVLQALCCSTDRVKQTKIIELLHEHFPFLESLGAKLRVSNPDPFVYFDAFRRIFTSLDNLRNY